jgi:hypothetical protein
LPEWSNVYEQGTTPLGRALWFDDADLAANRQGQLGLAQRARLEQMRRTWQSSERLLQWVVIAGYAGLAAFGLYLFGYAIVLRDASPLVGTLMCAVSAVLTWKLFGTSTRARHPPIPEQVLVAIGNVEVFTRTHGGGETVQYFVRVGELSFAVMAGAAKAFQDGVAYRLYYVDYMPGFFSKSLALNLARSGNGTLLSAEPISA